MPKGVACLLTALRIHELTTESPFEVWVAIGEKARRPRIDYPPIRILRHSGQSLSYESRPILRIQLGQWIAGEDGSFFPYRVPANLKLNSSNPTASITAIENLMKKSKESRGWGYSVHRSETRSRDFGKNLMPESIWIESLEDLLRLAEAKTQFEMTREVAQRVRHEFPSLDDWVKQMWLRFLKPCRFNNR